MNVLKKDKWALLFLTCALASYVTFLLLTLFQAPSLPAMLSKYAGVFSCLALTTSTYSHAFDKNDGRLLILALCLTLTADTIFVFAQAFEVGIAVFFFAHLCYIRRYKISSFRPFLILAVCTLGFWVVGTLSGLSFPYIYLLGTVYAVLILTATADAFHAPFPHTNKLLICTGMILFLLCDANAALSYLIPQSFPFASTANILMWVFYIPSQALLALSAYDYSPHYDREQYAIRNMF